MMYVLPDSVPFYILKQNNVRKHQYIIYSLPQSSSYMSAHKAITREINIYSLINIDIYSFDPV